MKELEVTLSDAKVIATVYDIKHSSAGAEFFVYIPKVKNNQSIKGWAWVSEQICKPPTPQF